MDLWGESFLGEGRTQVKSSGRSEPCVEPKLNSGLTDSAVDQSEE